MGWKVVATQQGQHNQLLRNIGEVFDLMTYPDGTYPAQILYTPKKDKAGVVIEDQYDEKLITCKSIDGKRTETAHRDFAEDVGPQLQRKGPKKGEVMRFGWMRRVPDDVPVGQYPLQGKESNQLPDFWGRVQLPQPYQVVPPPDERGPQDHRRNHAKIKDGYLNLEADLEAGEQAAGEKAA